MLQKYYAFKPFKETEAWTLFKLAAIAEAIGWTLLICGIVMGQAMHSNLPVLITGQLHGTLFLLYILAVLLFSPSLGWRPRKLIVAGLCSVPPYGALVFELWAAHNLKKAHFKLLFNNSAYVNILGNVSLLTEAQIE